MVAMDSSTFVWRETSPGRYERGIDEPELFYTSLVKTWEATGRNYFAITGCIEAAINISEYDDVAQLESRFEAALRKAWSKLRYDHPTLSSVVEYNEASQACKKVYETFINDENGSKESEWLNDSFITVSNGQSGTQFCNSDPPIKKHATLYMITPPVEADDVKHKTFRRDVVFRCHHNVTDGIGTLMLLNNLFRHASEAYSLQDDYPSVRFGDEFRNLSPPFRVAARIPSEPTDAQKSRARLLMAANAAVAKDAEVIGIPFDSRTRTPIMSQRTAIYLDEAETHRILQKIKEANISATQAFHAGIVLAVRAIQEPKEHDWQARYINYCLLNLRPFCDPPYNTAQHAAAVYHSASGRSLIIDVTIPAPSPSPPPQHPEPHLIRSKDFITIVAQIKSFYTAVRSDPEHLAMVPLYYDAVTAPYPHEPCTAIPAPNPQPSVSISSLGIVDKIIAPWHGPFRLRDPWVAADELSTGVGVFLATWEGRMCLSAGYNKAYHVEGEVVGFLQTVREAVFKGLGIEKDTAS